MEERRGFGIGSLCKLCGERLWQSVEKIPWFLWFQADQTFLFLRHGQYRERLVPLGPVAAYEPKDQCNSNSQGSAEGDEIPQRRKSKNEDQRAANCEDKAYESASDWELVHADAGMTICGHGFTSVNHPTNPCGTQAVPDGARQSVW